MDNIDKRYATVRLRQHSFPAGIIVFVLALVIRLIMLPVVSRGPLGEGHALLDAAANLANGKGLSLSESLLAGPEGAPPILARTLEEWRARGGVWGVVPPGEPTAFLPPAYPILLSALIRSPLPTVLAARVIGALTGALTAYLIYGLGSRLIGHRHGLVAGLLAAFHPISTFQSVEISTHGLAALTLVLPLFLLIRGRFTGRWALIAGLALGVAFLVRPTTWFMIPLAVIALWQHKRSLLGLGALLLGAAVIIGVWTARNAISVGKPLVFTTNGGRNLWEFNNQKLAPEYRWSEPPASRRLYDPIRASYLAGIRRQELLPFPAFHGEPEWERNEILTDRFMSFVQANPMVYSALVGVRVCQMFALRPLHYGGVIGVMFSVYSLPFLIISFTGLWCAAKAGGIPRLMAIYVLAFFCLHAATAAGFTYRGMVSPLLSFFAAAVLTGSCFRTRVPMPDECARPGDRNPQESRNRVP
jgi:4-amino-4-deoxy-L-arabinose transferase-like glycosyltransferase